MCIQNCKPTFAPCCMICEYFLPFCGLSFSSLDSVLWNVKVLNFDEVSLSGFFLIVAFVFGVVYKETLPDPRSWKFTPVFSSKSFIFLGLMFRSVVHFEVIFGCDMKKRFNFILLHVHIHLFWHHLLKILFFSPIEFPWHKAFKKNLNIVFEIFWMRKM